MRIKSLKVFIRVAVLGLLLGASSTANADSVAITSLTISNLQFNAATGTAVFTPTGVSVRADAANSFSQSQNIVPNTLPFAQASAAVPGANTFASANAANNTLTGMNVAMVGGCSCFATSFAVATLNGTLVIVGAEGSVDVNISALGSILRDLQTDQFGLLAQAELTFTLFVNSQRVFSVEVDVFHPLEGPNRFVMLEGSFPLSGTISLQSGVEHTISARLSSGSAAVSEVPEPATIVLLVSGLGFMTGVLKKRRDG